MKVYLKDSSITQGHKNHLQETEEKMWMKNPSITIFLYHIVSIIFKITEE